MNNSVTLFANGQRYDLPDSEVANFRKTAEASNIPVEDGQSFRTKDGDTYTIPSSQIESFRAAAPDAESVRPFRFADNSTKYMTMPEMSKFLRSKEWREGDEYKADREERDRAVASRISGGKTDDTSFLEEYSKGLADAGGTAIGRTLGGALSRFAKFVGMATELDPRSLVRTGIQRAIHGEAPITKEDFSADSIASKMRYNGGMFIGDQIDKATDILFPEEQKTDSAVAHGVGKAIGLGSGFAEFALMPTVALAGGHLAEGWEHAYDAAKARGATDEEAMTLGVMRGATDAAITTAFKNAPVRRIVGALGYKPSPAVLDALAKAGEKGVAGVTRGSVANAVGKQMLANAAISASEMGVLGGLQGFIDDAIMQEAEKGEIDWAQSWKTLAATGVEQAAFGAVMGLLPTPIKVREAVKQRDAILRETLADPMGVVAYAHANPEAGDALAQAWRKDGKVSRRVAREAGLPEMDEASRNNIGETIALYNSQRARDAQARVAATEAEIAKQPTEIKPNETRNGADEAPAQPKPPVESRAEGPEAVRPVEAPKAGGEAPDARVVEAKTPAKPAEAAQKPAEAAAELKVGEDTPKPAEGVEADSRASDATKAEPIVKLTKRIRKVGQYFTTAKVGDKLPEEDIAKIFDEARKRGYTPRIDADGHIRIEHNDGKWISNLSEEETNAFIESLNPKTKAELKAEKEAAEAAESKRLRDEGNAKFLADHKAESDIVAKMGFVNDTQRRAVVDAMLETPTSKQWERDLSIQSGKVISFLKENGVNTENIKTPAELRDALRSFMSKPVPDGKGKMVKPKAEKPVEPHAPEASASEAPKPFSREHYENFKEIIAGGKTVEVEGFPKGEALALKRGKEWIVVDGKSGMRFGRGKTKKDAVADATANLKVHTPKELEQALKTARGSFDAARDLHEPNGVKNPKFVEWLEKYAADKLAKEPKEGIPDKATEDAVRLSYEMQALEEASWERMTSKENVSAVFDAFKRLVEKTPPERDSNGTVMSTNVRRVAYEIEQSKFATEEQKSFVRKFGEKYGTAAGATADNKAIAAFYKTVKSALSEERRPSERLHDAAERLVDHIKDAYDGDTKVEKALDKALAKFKEKYSLEKFIKPSEASEYFKEFADELAAKYKVPGYDGKVDAPKYTGRKMNVGTVDSIQDKLFELRSKYADTDVIDEGIFDELPFREIDAKKLSARDKAELAKLEKELNNHLFDIDYADEITDKDGSIAEDWRETVDKLVEARDNLNRFLEQADRYQHLKRDKKGQPIFSPYEPAKRTVSDTIEELDRLIAAEERGTSAADEGSPSAEGLPSRSESWTPGKGISRVKALFGGLVSKNSIVRTIKDVFPEFAIRGKNTTRIGKSYAGHFEPWRELIRSKDMSSIDTIPHEVGHGISMRTKRKMMNIPQEVKRELAKMGRDLYGNKKPNGGYMEEGWAEYVRGYMTGADNLATEAPHLDKWFRDVFAAAHPDYVRKIDRVRREVMRYRMQSDLQRAAAEQRPETSAARRAWDKVMDFFSAENWNDEGATLTRGYKKSGLAEMHEWRPEMRELEKLVKKGQGMSQRAKDLAESINQKVTSDPRIFASNARGTSKARTMDMMKYGITNLTGTEKIGDVTGFDANGNAIRNNNTESYRDIFRDFTKKELADWDLYAAAKIGLENYVKKGKEFGVDKASLERRVAALENPKFLNALDRFTKMSRRALSVGLEAGALTPEQYKKIVGEHKYYVRTERRLAEDGAGGGKGQANPIHKIKGSTKNIMPPRLATMMQIEKQLRYFQTMKVLNMIAHDVRKAEVANTEFRKTGSGRDYQIGANLPMEVANAQEAVKFGSEKLRREVTKKMNDTGVTNPNTWVGNKTEADALFDQLFNDGDDMLTVFRERPSNGKNGLVSTYIDGKLVTFELPDAKWAKYITGMESGFDNGPSGKVWDAITAPGKLLRFGATTANPVFATANFVRDTLHSAIMSDTGAKPLVSSAVGMVNDMLGMDTGRLFKSMGGEMSMLMGSNKEAQFRHMQNAALADNILQQVAADTSLLHPFAGALRVYTDLLSKPEMGPRVREVMGVMKRAQAAGLDRETAAWLAFAAGKDISIDFGKHGRAMKILNQLIPYTNAWYRGLEQFARNMGLTKALPTQFEERQGRRAMRTAGRGLLYLSSVAVANGIANMLMMDDKERRAEFNKTPREKWEYDDILGTVRVPMPFELGAAFYAVPKAIVYEAFGDRGAVKEAIWHGLSTNLGKYSSAEDVITNISIIGPFVDMWRNKKWDGSPLVSPHIAETYTHDKQMWVDYSTTEAAKWVGEKMDWAPAYIDHVANTWTGGMWKRLLSPASDTSLVTQTGVSTFIPRPTARRDVNEFYEERSKLGSHYKAQTASVEDVGKLARANKLQEKLSPLFKEARELPATEPDKAERRKKREAIMDKAFDLIHEFSVEEADDRRGGLAKAAVALTNGVEVEKSVREMNLAVLKDVPFDEVAEALRAYGKEKVSTPIRNSAGYKTGRMKTSRRWEPETVSRRIRLLKKVLEEQP